MTLGYKGWSLDRWVVAFEDLGAHVTCIPQHVGDFGRVRWVIFKFYAEFTEYAIALKVPEMQNLLHGLGAAIPDKEIARKLYSKLLELRADQVCDGTSATLKKPLWG